MGGLVAIIDLNIQRYNIIRVLYLRSIVARWLQLELELLLSRLSSFNAS